MTKYIEHKSNNYCIFFPDITVKLAMTIDYCSYKNNNQTTFTEMISLFDNLDIRMILIDRVLEKEEIKSDFGLCYKAYEAIKDELFLSDKEFLEFTNECKMFLDDKSGSTKMPQELLIASNLLNNRLIFSLNDIENMNIKKYEKIQLALSLLKNKVEEAINL